jgi:hypothetical protein
VRRYSSPDSADGLPSWKRLASSRRSRAISSRVR